jgi:hypothetical protein
MTAPMVLPNGMIVWLDYEGNAHREGAKPAVINPDGSREYYEHGYTPRFFVYGPRRGLRVVAPAGGGSFQLVRTRVSE